MTTALMTAESMARSLAPLDDLEDMLRAGENATKAQYREANLRHRRCIWAVMGLMQTAKPTDVDLTKADIYQLCSDTLDKGEAGLHRAAARSRVEAIMAKPKTGPHDPGRHGPWNKILFYALLILSSPTPGIAGSYLRNAADCASKIIAAAHEPRLPHALPNISSVFIQAKASVQ